MGDDTGRPTMAGTESRCIALVGPYLGGKTTLLEALLARTEAVPRQGKINDGNTLGDASPEARQHQMSVELNIASTSFLGDTFTFVDIPGSIEFQHEGAMALNVCDAAVVVCEADPKRVPALQLTLKRLEELGVPHFLFLNKIDALDTNVRDIIPVLQPASARPLVLRQIPIWENGIATGYVDLASDRAFVYREHAPSEIVEMPGGLGERRDDARYQMLEQLADYDDELMEQLLADMEPPRDMIFDDLASELRDGVICPVLLGSAEHGNGVERLLKALRHEVAGVAATAERLGVEDTSETHAYVIKTIHTPHAGKASVARVLSGQLDDGAVVMADGKEGKVSGIFDVVGPEMRKRGAAKKGDLVGLGRLEAMVTGDVITSGKQPLDLIVDLDVPPPVYAMALGLKDRKDEVKLTTSIAKLAEEDPGLHFEHSAATHEMLLHGQGEMHLRVTAERLQRKFGISVETGRPATAYKETISRGTTVRARHKKQSGGHGQFGDVTLEIKPRPRGSGFVFSDTIVGGAVPKQFIPSVEAGVRDYLAKGPFGFEVVDLEVVLKDGSFHSVDSSDMAFRQAGRMAMNDGMADCGPVLLEQVMSVDIAVPNEATPRINAMIAQRRGHILGFDGRDGWPGWDVVQAHIPAAELGDLIIELRSATAGVGTFTSTFDHLAELSGRLADQVIADKGRVAA